MATCDYLHKKFLNISTAGLTVLTILDNSFEENPLEFIHKIVDNYHKKVQENPVNGKLHDAFRTLLCYEYQLKVNDTSQSTVHNSSDNLLKNLINILLHPDDNDENTRAILDDIAILQIILYVNGEDIDKLLKEILEFPTKEINRQNYLSIVENLVDALCLRKILKIDNDKSADVRNIIRFLLPPKIESWFQIINENNPEEWRPFLSIILKLTTAYPDKFIHFSWILVTGYKPRQDNKKSLTLLSGIIDDLFSSSSELSAVETNLSCIFNEKILSLISNHLISSVQSSRREAQYVLRSIVDYSRESPQDLLQKHHDSRLKPPFIFSEDSNLNIEEIKRDYFLLLETLEEKQAQLVLSEVNNLLDNLLTTNICHKSLIDITWIRCIFTRLLNHDNTTVIRNGLIAFLRMKIQIFDDEFISLFTQSLNHTFLYDNQSTDLHPKILKELSELFIKAENNKINFTSRFITSASRVTWLPIPLFYILEALGNNKKMAQVEFNIWGAEELKSLTMIANKYIKHQTKIMQIHTKNNILRCISIYVKSPLDLQTLREIFSVIRNDGFLERDNYNWNFITRYLKENIKESSALKFICESCELLKSEDDDRIKSLAVFIVLLYDSGSMFFKACVSSNPLAKLFSSLTHSSENPDDYSGFITSLKLIISLMELSPKHNDTYVMLIFGFSKCIVDLICNGPESRLPHTHDEAIIYVKTITAMIKLGDLSPNFTESITNMMKIEETEVKRINQAINCDTTPLIQSWYSLNILYLSNNELDKYPKLQITNENDEKIISDFYYLIAKIYHRRITTNDKLPHEFYQTFLTEKLIILGEIKSHDGIPLITAIIRSILHQLIIKIPNPWPIIDDCGGIIQDIINICWDNLWNMKRTPEFWTSAKKLIKLIWSDLFLKVHKFKPIALEYADDLISRTDNTSPLRCILFTQMNKMYGKNILLCRKAIFSSILQTDVGKINSKRIEMQTCRYIMKTNNINLMTDEHLMTGLGVYTDVINRALVVTLILKLGNNTEHRERKEFLFIYVPQLISLLEEQKNKIYFKDSDVHRIKHRLLQILLLLNLEEENAKKVHDTLCGLILSENNLPSVRIMQEWVLIKIYVDNEDMTDLIWNLFPSFRQHQPKSLMSLMSIVYHVAKGLCPKERLVYLQKAVTHILPSCFAQQTSVQMHSQVILLKLFKLICDISPQHWAEYKCIRKAVEENLRYGSFTIKAIKMMEDFYFSVFDADGDFNLQTIFYDIPRLSHVAMDEWIDPDLFDSMLPGYLRVQWFRYYENGGKLINRERQALNETDETVDFSLLDISHDEEALVHIQTDIIPGNLESTNNELSVAIPMSSRQQFIINDTGLIVIASLIEGFPNLGSLARTAEILCARELILKSMRYTENEEFRKLSVTAEKWITISEVKPHELCDYLLEKKSMGWKLVGAEQRVNSVNLLDMKFNEKTVLLLGNEKNGIPANLIQLLDTCVEIPQAGVARSLNAHVTGAICMWQYAQQHLF